MLSNPIARALVAGVLVSQSAFATTVVEDVGAQLKRLKGTKSSFCFAVENGAVTGINESVPVRAASITKTVTTFWALKRHGPDYRFSTRISVQPSNHEVHISGARDPFFDRDRLFALLADLNKMGIKEISRLTFDSGFWFWPDATEWRYLGAKKSRHMKYSPRESFFLNESHTRATVAGNPAAIKAGLNALMNTASWPAHTRSRYASARSMNTSAALPPKAPAMKTDVIDLVPSNPLAGKPGVLEFEVKSAPIKMYLKQMNIRSSNPYAEEMFFSLGGKTQFAADMARLGYGDQTKEVYSGSGVNLYNSGNRFDSKLSCSTVVRMIRTMDKDLEAKGGDLTDVMMAPAVDGGTANWIDGSKAFVVKTGTLKRPVPAKNLAGVEETKSGEVYFGIFLDGRAGHSYGVRKAQSAMMTHFRPVAVNSARFNFSPMGAWSHMQKLGAEPLPKTLPEPPAVDEIVITASRPAKPAAPAAVPAANAAKPPVLKVDMKALS
jgi:D-alanyl-D-alanine carboxypeptidase/D-alanyl-D-alanine-endopeptidase (penicillin-binding protein 4)